MSIEKMIEDTLYEKRMAGTGCFVSNEAAEELLKAGPGALPAMERAIREVIEPALKLRPLPTDAFLQNAGPLPGLDDLLGAFLVIGLTSDPARVISFLRAVDEVVLVEAVVASGTFFAKSGTGFRFGVVPPDSFIAFLGEQSRSSSVRLQKAAVRALAFITKGVAP